MKAAHCRGGDGGATEADADEDGRSDGGDPLAPKPRLKGQTQKEQKVGFTYLQFMDFQREPQSKHHLYCEQEKQPAAMDLYFLDWVRTRYKTEPETHTKSAHTVL